MAVKIPTKTRGLCALVRLAAPLTLIGDQTSLPPTRFRRELNFDLSPGAAGSKIYIDATGIPQGVPDEYKLADPVASGFENLPIIGAIFPVTTNKNVARINFIIYNVLRLTNLTRDAVEGLVEQLAPTSKMAVQNRLALDMVLAERGGVCSMIGE